MSKSINRMTKAELIKHIESLSTELNNLRVEYELRCETLEELDKEYRTAKSEIAARQSAARTRYDAKTGRSSKPQAQRSSKRLSAEESSARRQAMEEAKQAAMAGRKTTRAKW